jgi:hypothetical protein
MKTLNKKPIQMYIEPGPAAALIGLGSSSGKGDVSVQHDKYLVKYAKAGHRNGAGDPHAVVGLKQPSGGRRF